MQNKNSNTNTVLLVIIILLLCALLFWKMGDTDGKKLFSDNLVNKNQLVIPNNNSNYKVEPTPTPNPTPIPNPVATKPVATTLAWTNYSNDPACSRAGGSPCPEQPHMTLNGNYKSIEGPTTTWFEYWWIYDNGDVTPTHSTPHVIQKANSGDVSYTLRAEVDTDWTAMKYYRFVSQNSAGITYGETKSFTAPK